MNRLQYLEDNGSVEVASLYDQVRDMSGNSDMDAAAVRLLIREGLDFLRAREQETGIPLWSLRQIEDPGVPASCRISATPAERELLRIGHNVRRHLCIMMDLWPFETAVKLEYLECLQALCPLERRRERVFHPLLKLLIPTFVAPHLHL